MTRCSASASSPFSSAISAAVRLRSPSASGISSSAQRAHREGGREADRALQRRDLGGQHPVADALERDAGRDDGAGGQARRCAVGHGAGCLGAPAYCRACPSSPSSSCRSSTTSTRSCTGRATTTRSRGLREQGWLARSPLALRRARARGGELLPAHAQRGVPGQADRRAVRDRRGPAATRRSSATSCTSTAPTTGGCATSSTRRSRRAPPTAGGPVMRDFLEELYAAVPADGELRLRRGLRQAVPGADDRDGDGRARARTRRGWRSGRTGSSASSTRRRCSPSATGSSRRARSSTRGRTGCSRERRTTPGDDLVSTLIAEEQDGDRLSDVELVNLVLNVLVGGVDTTQSQLAHAVRLFAEHPEQWELVRDDPERYVPRAVEEALRYEPITPFTARIMRRGRRVRRRHLPRGTRSSSSPPSPPTATASRTRDALRRHARRRRSR